MTVARDNLSPLFGWRGAIAASALEPPSRHVALTLSLYMNERGGSAFPSVETLAKDTGLSGRAVQQHLGKLVNGGWLSRTPRTKSDGSRDSNLYTAVIPREVVNQMQGGGEPPAPGVVNVSVVGGERGSPESVSKTSIESAIPRAEVLLSTWWEQQDPRPTSNYPGARKILDKLLKAGWSEPEVLAALDEAPTISTGCLEIALKRARNGNGHHDIDLTGFRRGLAEANDPSYRSRRNR